MRAKEDMRPISYVKAHALEVLNQVSETQRPIYITQNGEARTVLLDVESYEKMTRVIGLLKLLTRSEQDLMEGSVRTQEEVFAEMDEHVQRPKP